MKTKRVRIINLIVAVLVALFCVGQIFAWFSDGEQNRNQKFGGSSASSYFAGGTGSKDDPFILTNKYHVYNLAWLQDTGCFGEDKYYFAVENDIQMDDMWVPPIGTDDNPFISEFDGRGHTIWGLKVTTNRDKLTLCPVVHNENFKFSRAVGFFGYTQNKSSNDKSKIQNFILENPFVEVAVNNAPYSNESNCVAGLAVGHVAGVVSSIGVRATEGGTQATELNIYVASENLWYSTFNSILGELAEGASSSVTGGGAGGSAGGAGGSFGNTFDTGILLNRLGSIAKAKYGLDRFVKNAPLVADPTAWRLPALSNSGNSNYWTLAQGEKLAFAKVGDHYSDPEPYEEVAKDSSGYFLGSGTLMQNKLLKIADRLTLSADGMYYYATDADGNTGSPYELGVTPNWLYTQPHSWTNSNYEVGHQFAPVAQSTFDNLPTGIKNLVTGNPGETQSFTAVSVQTRFTQYTQRNPGEWMQIDDEDWSYHGQIIWNGEPYGKGLKSNPYNSNGDSYAVDEYGHRYTSDGYPLDSNNYRLNDDLSYVINIDGWSTPVFELDSSGRAIFSYDGRTYSYYIDGNLIDENNFLFNFEGNSRRYVSALEGWALPIYGVEIDSAKNLGYALDEHGNRYEVNEFYELDENGFYKRANGTYVIKTPNWDIPIYVVDENGYALTEEGGLYYTTILGVYHKDGTCKFYDENGNPLILVDGQYIVPYGFDANGYAINENGYWYTSTADSYLKYENGTYYRVDANGNRQINDNGRIVTPDAFDASGYAMIYDENKDRYYYYNAADNNIFYHKKGNTYYQISKSVSAGNIWTYVPKSGSFVYTEIDDNGYALYDDNWYYTTTDDVFQDKKGYFLHGDGGYILNNHPWSINWILQQNGYFADDNETGIQGIYYANEGASGTYVKGAYYTDTNGYVITTTGAYALDSSNKITGERILYDIDSSGRLLYSSGPHKGQRVIIKTPDGGNQYEIQAISQGYDKVQTASADSWNIKLAQALKGSSEDRIEQAKGTIDDRVQATHDNDFVHDYVTVKRVANNDYNRPVGVRGDAVNFREMRAGIFLPNSGVWFKPSKAGMIRFVMYADSPNQNFVLLKMERQIHTDGSVSFDDKITKVTKAITQQLPANVMFYYEYEVTQSDIDAGNVEFLILCESNITGGSSLLYLDVGASAMVGDGEDVSTVNPDVDVSAVDFIYAGVSINQNPSMGGGISFGDFIVGTSLYEATKTSIYFKQLQNTLKIVFVRLASRSDEKTIDVTATGLDTGLPNNEVNSTRPKYSLINGN